MSWVRLDDGFADHPKIMALGRNRLACMGIHVAALCYCARHLTDGLVPMSFAGQFPDRLVDALVFAGLWETVDQPYGVKDFRIHDYLSYNPSRGAILEERAAKRRAGSIGGSTTQARRTARAKASASGVLGEVPNPRPLPVPSASNEALDARAEVPDGRDDLEAWVLAKHRIPTPGQRRYLDLYCDTFDLTGPARAAKLILSHADDPIAALKADRDAFLQERAAAIVIPPKPNGRRSGGGLTGINAELARILHERDAAL